MQENLHAFGAHPDLDLYAFGALADAPAATAHLDLNIYVVSAHPRCKLFARTRTQRQMLKRSLRYQVRAVDHADAQQRF